MRREGSFGINPNPDPVSYPVRDCDYDTVESESVLREVGVPVLSKGETETVESNPGLISSLVCSLPFQIMSSGQF